MYVPPVHAGLTGREGEERRWMALSGMASGTDTHMCGAVRGCRHVRHRTLAVFRGRLNARSSMAWRERWWGQSFGRRRKNAQAQCVASGGAQAHVPIWQDIDSSTGGRARIAHCCRSPANSPNRHAHMTGNGKFDRGGCGACAGFRYEWLALQEPNSTLIT